MNELFEKLAAEINQLESWKEITTSDKHPFCASEIETVSKHKVIRILRNGLEEYAQEMLSNTNKQKSLNVSGHDFFPGDFVDYISWITEDAVDEAYNVILRTITDKGIVVFDIDEGADVFIPKETILAAVYYDEEIVNPEMPI